MHTHMRAHAYTHTHTDKFRLFLKRPAKSTHTLPVIMRLEEENSSFGANPEI